MTFFFFFSYFQDRVQLSSQRDGFCFMKYSFMTGLGSNHRQTPLQLCHVGKGSWRTHMVPVLYALHAKEKRTCKQHNTIGFLGLNCWPGSLYLIYISLNVPFLLLGLSFWNRCRQMRPGHWDAERTLRVLNLRLIIATLCISYA